MIGGVVLSLPVLHYELGFVGKDAPAYDASVNAMGTTVTFRIEDEIDSDASRLAVGSAVAGIRKLETLLTRFPGGTEICQLNASGALEDPSQDVLRVIRGATGYSERTEGSFDVTVKPVLDLLQAYLAGAPFPTDAQFDAAKRLIDYEHVTVDDKLVEYSAPGTQITLDGIATGYILDSAVAALKSSGIRSAFVNVGGTVSTIGSRADGTPWAVGVRDPMNPSSTMATLQVSDMTVATSGDYEDYFTPDKKYYHIIDPSTARSPLYSHSATVVAPTATMADPLGVAMMVEDPQSALKLADSAGVASLLYTEDGRVLTTAGIQEMTS